MVDYLKIKKAYNNALSHSRTKGSKNGHRRYQYEDGSLTPEGVIHYREMRRQKTGYYDRDHDSDENEINKKSKSTEQLKTDTTKKVEFDPSKAYTWTDKSGKKRVYKSEFGKLDDKQVAALQKRMENEKKIADAYKEPDGPNISDALRDTSKLLDATARAFPTGGGKYVKKDYSHMTDQQLRDKISRLQLEESYGRLTGETKYVKSGSEKTREILQTAGVIVAIGGSAVALADTIRRMIKSKAEQGEIKEYDPNALSHHGIKGQKWGVRRFQNEDGSLTADGERRYNTNQGIKEMMDNTSSYNKLIRKQKGDYVDYGRKEGGRKGFLAGMGIGALVGAGKVGLNMGIKAKRGESLLGDNEDASDIVNRFVRGAILGSMGGALVGTLTGAKVGEKNAKAKLAAHGREYVDELLNTPVDRLRRY